MHPERLPHPVRDVVSVSIVVGLLVAALGWLVLWPISWQRSARSGLMVGYVLVLVVFLMTGMVTDLAGIAYVLPVFAFATLLLLGARALWRVGRRDRASPIVE